MTKYEGYMAEAEFDGTTLRMRGTNKAGQLALAGAEHTAGDVVLSRGEITDAHLKPASMLVNGNLRITAADGRRFQFHFRKKHAAGVTELARALDARET